MKNKEKYQEEILEAFVMGKDCNFKWEYVLKSEGCKGVECVECRRKTKQWLEEEESKEPIRLTQFEYNLLKVSYDHEKGLMDEGIINEQPLYFSDFGYLMDLKGLGNYANVQDVKADLKEILDNYIVVK